MVIEELNRLKIKWSYSGTNHVVTLCPFHDDNNASLSLNYEHGSFNCFSCNSKGVFPQYLAKVQNISQEAVLRHLIATYNYKYDDLVVTPQIIDAAHFRLLEAPPLLQELEKRAVSLKTAEKFKLGEENGRIFIPIYAEGKCVNVQTYSPGARNKKFVSIIGSKMERFYPDNQLDKQKIVVAGGLVKALACIQALEGTEYGAVSVTAGEGVWTDELTLKLKGKDVYLAFDIDTSGKRAARKIARKLGPYAASVREIKLPLDQEVYPKGGVDDFIAKGGDLKALLDSSEPMVFKKFDEKLKSHEDIETLTDVYTADNSLRELSVPAYVSGVCETPFMLPHVVQIHCNYDSGQQGLCSLCPVYQNQNEDFIHEIDTRSRNFMAMANKEDSKLRKIISRDIGIPSKCAAHQQHVLKHETVEEIRISSVNSVSTLEAHKDNQPAFIIGKPVEANQNYKFSGVMYPHPDTQVSTLVFNEHEILQESVDSWQLRKPERMEVLRAEAGVEGIRKKLDEIYTHLELNVTKIYNRRAMTMMYDLTYHSAILIQPFGDKVRGWLESLICGDSACGKSDSMSRLMKFYGVGKTVDCGNVTAVGLIGGNEQSNGKHFVVWGELPRNDRGLLNFEELASMPTTIFNMLTEVRTSGVARITKISSKSALSRTRITANSNPRGKRPVSTYPFGVEVISELINSPADIRRFDMAIVVKMDEVEKTPPPPGPKFSDEVLRDCLMFAWTRKPEQIVFTDPEELNEAAKRMCKEFVSDKIPLVDQGSQNLKIARIATAIAARTWSVLDNETIVVNKFHIQVAEEYLRDIYTSETMGYKKLSDSIISKRTLRRADEVALAINKAWYPEPLVEMLNDKGIFEIQDLMDYGGGTKEDAAEFVGTLIRSFAIERKNKTGYVKTPAFIEFLKDFVPVAVKAQF